MDSNEFKKIFIPLNAKLFNIAFRLLSSRDEAQDAIQESYIKLWRNRDSLGEIDTYEAYAVTIVKNTCFDIIRKRNYSLVDYREVSSTSSISKEIEAKDEMKFVEQLILQLPESQQVVMKLKHWGEYSDEEIEKLTGLSAVNIRVLLSRARKTIREKYLSLRG